MKNKFVRLFLGSIILVSSSQLIAQSAYFKASSSEVRDMALTKTSGFWYSDSAYANQIDVPQGTNAYYANLNQYSAFMQYDGVASAKISGSQWSSGTMTKAGGYVAVNDFTVNATNTNTKNSTDSDYFIVIGGDANLNVANSMTLNFGNSGTAEYSAQKLLFWNKAKLSVGSDLFINNTNPTKSDGTNLKIGVQFAEGTTSGSASSMVVNGRLVLANDVAENGKYGNADAYFGISTITIKQNVVLNGNMIDFFHRNSVASKSSTLDVSSLKRYIGGIGVATGTSFDDRGYTGRIQSTATGNVWLNLTNTQSYEYAGAFANNVDGLSNINVVMNGSASAKQILRLNSVANYWSAGVELSNANIASVAVKSGTLELAMISSRRVNSFSMEGGNFSATSLALGSNTGSLNIDSLTWTDGTIIFDSVDATNFDKLIISGEFNKSSDVKNMYLEFSMTSDELANLGAPYMDFIFMTFDSTNITDLNDFQIKTQDGVAATLNWVEIDGIKSGIGVQLQAVPEPAVLAALFGALALVLAAYRRR